MVKWKWEILKIYLCIDCLVDILMRERDYKINLAIVSSYTHVGLVKMATASKSAKRRFEIVENNENSAEVVS